MPDPGPLVLASIEPLLRAALAEDVGRGDATTDALVPADADAVADLVAKADGVLAGVVLVAPLLRLRDPSATVTVLRRDGERVAAGDRVAEVRGRARGVLSAERTALNFVRRLSGIATTTARFVEAVRGTGATILDTRKTTPGWRVLEKYAVRCGGASNHRLGLDDAAMIKENHLIDGFGGTGAATTIAAIRRARAALPPGMALHVEVETFEEFEAAVDEGADVVMLDGFAVADLRRAVARVAARPAPRPLLEATGGVTLDTVTEVARTGVDRISIGALTHSAPALDLSLRHRPR